MTVKEKETGILCHVEGLVVNSWFQAVKNFGEHWRGSSLVSCRDVYNYDDGN